MPSGCADNAALRRRSYSVGVAAALPAIGGLTLEPGQRQGERVDSHPRGTARMSKLDRCGGHVGSVLLIVAPNATDGVTSRAFWFVRLQDSVVAPTPSHEIAVCIEDRT